METSLPFWTAQKEYLFRQLATSPTGLAEKEAQLRLVAQRKKQRSNSRGYNDLLLMLDQFRSPLVLLLVFAVLLSIVLGEYSDSIIILAVLLVTGILGFVQERNAGRAVEKLQELVHSRAMVRRDGVEREILVDETVPGDIVLLNAGDVIPADALILEANDLHVNESVLSGESFPAEKFALASSAATPAQAANALFKGTSVVNGTATILCVHTGGDTELGRIASSLRHATTVTAFEKGILHFGYLLMRMTILFTGLILILNIVFHRSFMESLLFSLALTVGLTPELLPAIFTVTLAAGAKRMAAKKVIVKKLSAIQNLGEMDVLCSDKTGTITEGLVSFTSAEDVSGQSNPKLVLYGYLNAMFESGFSNPIDEALRRLPGINMNQYQKCDEVPYDFIRKRLSIVAAVGTQHIMITKGAVDRVLDVCSAAETAEGIVEMSAVSGQLQKRFSELSREGSRVIGIGYKDVTGDPVIDKDDEKAMTFLGFLVFSDPLKKGIPASVQKLKQKGISLKIITGDNLYVAAYLAKQVDLRTDEVLTGSDLDHITTDALKRKMEETDVFAEIMPAQKERIVRALQQAGHSVGYIGDGINDANALNAADVGISINNAVDVAKEAADLVLLDQGIDVIQQGVEEGRRTFINAQKYILFSTSANFGNMFSMAIASLILPFLPLLPVQVLLGNFLSDLPAISIASDHVDDELTTRPQRWSMSYIRKFMIVFGLQSSVFDFATFGLLFYIFHAPVAEFRTAWFMESLLTEILILLVVRTQRPLLKSSPSKYLLAATIFIFLASITIPYLPFAGWFELCRLPATLLVSIMLIVLVYIVVAELSKKVLIRKLRH